MKNKFTLAAIQLNSQDDKEQNLKNVERYIAEAASKRVDIVALPEMMNYIGKDYLPGEEIPGRTTNILCKLAKKYNLWIHGGSISESNGEKLPFNTTVFINPNGEIIAKYSKLHMFDVELKDGTKVQESDHFTSGEEIVTAQTDLATFGFAICYDMRFPELFRIMALQGAQVIIVPANFTIHTGKDHWESLLRARAIENACYVVAPAQIGNKSRFASYGKTMIIDPWGNVIAKASDIPCVITAEIDLNLLVSIRAQIPSIKSRREDVYKLERIY